MRSPSRPPTVLRWSPSPTRRALTLSGLALSALLFLARIVSIPWSWRYINDVYPEVVPWLVLIPSVILLRLDLRRVFPPGHCHKCGYDLTGNVSGVCPECGEKVEAQQTNR